MHGGVMKEGLTMPETRDWVREFRTPFMSPDIADLAAQYLQEKGVKMWR